MKNTEDFRKELEGDIKKVQEEAVTHQQRLAELEVAYQRTLGALDMLNKLSPTAAE